MKSKIFFLIAIHIAVLWDHARAAQEEKELIMLEIEPITKDERVKRSSKDSALRFIRQAANLPPEYLNYLQQLTEQQQQQIGGPTPQPQQQLIQQIAVVRDGSKPSAAGRYVFTPDGSIVRQNLGIQGLSRPQNEISHLESYVNIPQDQPPAEGPQLITPALDAFSRAQTEIQQGYHDSPISTQIAGLGERPDPVADTLRNPPPPSGPSSPAPQVFSQAAAQALAQHQARIQAQLQSPNPNVAVAAQLQQLQFDPNAYLQLQQQPQPQFTVANQLTGRQLNPFQPQPQQVAVYQQAKPAVQARQKATIIRRPIGSSAQAQLGPSTQAQLHPQDLPQQYLVETSNPTASPSVRYVDDLSQQAFQQQLLQEQQQASLLDSFLQPSPGRGLFTPAQPKAARPTTFAPRAGPRPTPVTPAPTEEKLPTLRIPPPSNQRPLTRAELDALVSAGYSITPVGSEVPQGGFFKSKRAPLPLLEQRRNHVIYQNMQDGVSYQYSPGSSDYNPAPKAKRDAQTAESSQGVVTYAISSPTTSA